MIEIDDKAVSIFYETMKKVGLDTTQFAVIFHVDKDNRFYFNFTDDIYFAKPQQGLLVVDETGAIDVRVLGVTINGRTGIIIKEKE
jgi:hypothetical protein